MSLESVRLVNISAEIFTLSCISRVLGRWVTWATCREKKLILTSLLSHFDGNMNLLLRRLGFGSWESWTSISPSVGSILKTYAWVSPDTEEVTQMNLL